MKDERTPRSSWQWLLERLPKSLFGQLLVFAVVLVGFYLLTFGAGRIYAVLMR